MKIIDHYNDSRETAKLYISTEYSIILLPYNGKNPILFMSIANGPYHVMYVCASMQNNKIRSWNITDIHNNKKYDFYVDENNAMLNASVLHTFMNVTNLDKSELDIEYISFPNSNIFEAVLIGSPSEINLTFTVHRPEFNWDYETFSINMFIDEKQTLLDVEKVDRYRDGGTTVYKTKQGTLFVPANLPAHLNKAITWTDNSGNITKLLRIDFSDFSNPFVKSLDVNEPLLKR